MIEKACKIDYLAFTHYTEGTEKPPRQYHDAILERLSSGIPVVFDLLWNSVEWSHGNGQRPYAFSIRCKEGIFIFYDHRQKYTLVQISGQGCDWLRKLGILDSLLELVAERVTRMDVAVDILCDVLPKEFVDAGYNNKIKSVAWQRSQSGETCYLGSRTSEIMTRIYRYNEPHPRADRLRIEHELKGKKAKEHTKIYLQDGIEVLENVLALARKFAHPVWSVSELATSIPQMVGRKSQNDTIAWLFRQVAPAVARLVRDGVINDPTVWLTGEFMGEVNRKLGE